MLHSRQQNTGMIFQDPFVSPVFTAVGSNTRSSLHVWLDSYYEPNIKQGRTAHVRVARSTVAYYEPNIKQGRTAHVHVARSTVAICDSREPAFFNPLRTKNFKYLSIHCSLIFERALLFWKALMLHPSVRPETATHRWR
jgi:hypothetical protein